MEPYDSLATALDKFDSIRATLTFKDGKGRRITVFVYRMPEVIELMHHKYGCITLKFHPRPGWVTKWSESVRFFKWFLYQDYETDSALIDQVEALFQHPDHLFRPVQLRLAHIYKDRGGRRVRAVCTIFNSSQSEEYTVRIEHRGEYKSLRDSMTFIVRDQSAITGSSVTGDVGTLIWFLNQPYKLTRAGSIRESCDQYCRGAADWSIPCSDFYFIRAGYIGNTPRQMSGEMRRYIADPNLFRLSDEIRQYVLKISSTTHILNGRKENLTVRRLFTKADKAAC